jgi:hypothetical protein
MFDNLLYIFTKNNQNINNIKEIENTREIKRLNLIIIKKNTELKILQYKYNKLLNNCIQQEYNQHEYNQHEYNQHELNKKKDIVPDIALDIVPDIVPDIAANAVLNSDTYISQFNFDINEYEKI